MATIKKYNGSSWENAVVRKFGTATEAVENPLYSDGTAITAYTLKGNEEHTGTPSPSNPVMPNGVGERTENLFDYNAYFNSTFVPYNEFFEYATIQLLPNTTYTLSTSIRETVVTTRETPFIVATTNQMPTTADGGISNISPVTITTENDGILKLYKRLSGRGIIPTKKLFDDGAWLMLNTGSTAKPFEPYGYKIPISSGQQTIEIYIGDLPLLKSLDGTAVDEISNGTLTRRVDSDGSVLPTPTTTQITMPSIPTTEGANSITVDTTVQPSEFTATWTGWHDAEVKEKSENLAYDILVQDLQPVYSIVLLFSADLEPDTTYTLSFDSISGFYFYINEQVFNVKYINTVTGRNQVICTTKSALDKSDNRQYLNGRWIILKNATNQPTNIDITNVMLNEGSTALPYEPYWK